MWVQEPFGVHSSGREITRFIGHVDGSPVVSILDRGATIQGIRLGGVHPNPDVAVGFTSEADYTATRNLYVGAVVGRYANRIGSACFDLSGENVQLLPNEGGNTLHGGPCGFDTKMWDVEDISEDRISLKLISPHGDQGFPGTLMALASYRLSEGSISLELSATTDAPTVACLTSHLYLNLDGQGSADQHILWVDSQSYLPIDRDLMPLGSLHPVAGTPFDFRVPRRIIQEGARRHAQTALAGGIDHSYQLEGSGFRPVASLSSAKSNRMMTLWSDQPALQVFSGGIRDDALWLSDGRSLRPGFGIALEPQIHPDSPNRAWGGMRGVLAPGERWTSRIEWRFSELASS